MAKRIVLLLLLLVVVAVAGSYAYSRYRTDVRYNRGEVTASTGGAPVLTNSRSETPESRSNWDDPNQDGQVQPNQPVRTRLAAEGQQLRADGAKLEAWAGRRNPPPADSQPRNAPDGMTFAATGKFEVYRQGDLTWRVNTDTGKSCVLFATLEQWRKPIVYRKACPDS